jgi:hypothetical protein
MKNALLILLMLAPAIHADKNSASVVQVVFNRPVGMQIGFDTKRDGSYDGQILVTPARHDFMVGTNGDIVRMKLSNIEGHEAIELFPTLELAPMNQLTKRFLKDHKVPVQFTQKDLLAVSVGNFITKVIYIPFDTLKDSERGRTIEGGFERLISYLSPGEDPIVKASKKGAIVAILRVGSKLPTKGHVGWAHQFIFVRPTGMQIKIGSQLLTTPSRHDFLTSGKGGVFGMKLKNVAGYPAAEILSTIEITPVNPITAAYLDHTAVPMSVTDEDLKKSQEGFIVRKAIILAKPDFKGLFLNNLPEDVCIKVIDNYRLKPTQDLIEEANKRGAILAIVTIIK